MRGTRLPRTVSQSSIYGHECVHFVTFVYRASLVRHSICTNHCLDISALSSIASPGSVVGSPLSLGTMSCHATVGAGAFPAFTSQPFSGGVSVSPLVATGRHIQKIDLPTQHPPARPVTGPPPPPTVNGRGPVTATAVRSGPGGPPGVGWLRPAASPPSSLQTRFHLILISGC